MELLSKYEVLLIRWLYLKMEKLVNRNNFDGKKN